MMQVTAPMRGSFPGTHVFMPHIQDNTRRGQVLHSLSACVVVDLSIPLHPQVSSYTRLPSLLPWESETTTAFVAGYGYPLDDKGQTSSMSHSSLAKSPRA
jgi:hypothetical protein